MCSAVSNFYNNNYNDNCLFDTTICYFVDNHNCFGHTQLHTRQTKLLLTRCLLSLVFLYVHTFSGQNVLKVKGSLSCLFENSIATACICALSYLSVLFSFMLVVIGLLGSFSIYLLVCIVFTLFIVCSLIFILC